MKIAILGGTFDPVHNGHLELARSVLDTFDIDEFHFVPAFAPPHKPARGITSPFHRFAMVALATIVDERFRVSSLEADTLAPCYSVDTLRSIDRRCPGAPLLFITGTDLYGEIEEWRSWQELFTQANMAVIHRPGFPMRADIQPFRTIARGEHATLEPTPGVYYLPWVSNDISSTRIREEAAAGRDTARWTPPEVAAYIRRHELYPPHA